MFQVDGCAEAVRRENVRWYVGAYFIDRDVLFAMLAFASVDSLLLTAAKADGETSFARRACSSANTSCNLVATIGPSVDGADCGG